MVDQITDKTLDELVRHEYAHLAVVRILYGSVADENAASRLNLKRWGQSCAVLWQEQLKAEARGAVGVISLRPYQIDQVDAVLSAVDRGLRRARPDDSEEGYLE